MKGCITMGLVLLALIGAGCSSTRQITDFGPRYRPTNYVGVAKLPETIRRVALLPTAAHGQETATHEGLQQLTPVLEAELRKRQAVEIVRVSSADLQQWTGRRAWRADEALPPELLRRVCRETGSDAVLFATMTVYRPYPPLALGWDLRLVEPGTADILWAVDEVLDAGSAPVVRACKDYYEAQVAGQRASSQTAILQSPRLFGQFASAMVASTLPGR